MGIAEKLALGLGAKLDGNVLIHKKRIKIKKKRNRLF